MTLTPAQEDSPDTPLLRAERLSFGFQERVVLKEVDLEIPRRGTLALLGPAGAGKSTLLRTLGRWNELHPAFWCHGSIHYDGRDLRALPLEDAQREVALLAQKARLYTSSILDNAIAETRGERMLSRADKHELARAALEPLGLWQELRPLLERPVVELSIARQRMLAVARLLSGGARCLLADEPLRDVDEREQRDMRAFLRRVAELVAVVLVEHDQQAARELSDHVCLITGHRIVERAPASAFFHSPRTELGQQYLRSGNCWPAQPSEPPPPGQPAAWVPTEQEQRARPGGFHWILPGMLGGMQQPGLLCELEDDLAGLVSLGVRHLVTLTEQPFTHPRLSELGIRCTHFPIPDMGVPDLQSASSLCAQIATRLDAGEPVVLHCKAGLGRTGTMLACVLVHRGEAAVRAIHRVRAVNTRYIQSDTQLRFISDLEHHAGRERVPGR